MKNICTVYNSYLTVSNMVTRDRRVVTSSTIRPGTMSGITTKLPQDIMTNNELGRYVSSK